MKKVHVNLGKDSYDILIGKNLLDRASEELNLERKVLVITDSGVPSVYAKKILSQCKEGFLFVFEQGEKNKTLKTFEKIQKTLMHNNFSRKDCIIALGGGIVGDISGFAASSYMRGIDSYMIPTTVLSQVDSSVGGKTAVNLGKVKNIVGAFYQPKKVLIDPNVLETLPKRQISNGLVEALKMAATFDSELFSVFLNSNPFNDLENIVEKSVSCKAKVVEQDEKELSLRKVLNFGHTIGHAVESSKLGELYHGECVALGMLTMCNDDVRVELEKCLLKLDVPTKIALNKKSVMKAIEHDKKANATGISTVYVKKIGSFTFIERTLEELRNSLDVVSL